MTVLRALRRRWRETESLVEFLGVYRSFHLTREGWFFIAVTFAIGIAALNTGHNLFYLIFAMLVSMIIVSGMLSERAVRGLRIERRPPGETFARSATAIEIVVRNVGRWRTAYAVEVREGRIGEPRRCVGFVDRLDAGEERRLHALWRFERRGRHRFRPVHLVTRFPFGLFEKTRIVPLSTEVLVLPAIDPTEVRAAGLEAGPATLRKHRLGDEVVGLRPHRAEDDLRRVHWKASARAAELLVREHGESLEPPVAIYFDPRGEGDRFERAVERAASLVWGLDRVGRAVRFFAPGLALDGGRDALGRALEYLAEVEPLPADAARATTELERWHAAVAGEGRGIYVTAGKAPGLPPGAVLRVA